MKILMVSLVNLGRSEGNTGHQLGLFESWIRQGHDVRLITPRRPGGGNTALPHAGRIAFSTSVTGLGLPPIFDVLPQILTIAYYRIRYGYRYLYLRASSLSFILALAGRIMGMRVIAEHNSWMSSERSNNGSGRIVAGVEERFQLWLARVAHRSRCVSAGIGKLLAARGISPERLFVVGNGTDTGHFFRLDREQALKSLNLDSGRIWIGFLGSMNPWQGIATTIRALALLRDDARLHMILAGDGPEREALLALVSELGLEDRVVFCGHVSRAEANTIINCFDIAVAPYTRERNAEIGLSAIKIRDYAAAGRIVVASDLNGIRELADEGWLHTHEPDDPEKLAQAIRDVLGQGDDANIHNAAARRYAEEHFSWDGIAARVARNFLSPKEVEQGSPSRQGATG